MSEKKYHVVGIGNAIVDVLAKVDDAFVEQHHLIKGSMNLVDAERALYLSNEINDAIVRSGGSAGNTIAALAELGASSAFFGKLADDDLGEQYRQDMTSLGVFFPTEVVKDQAPTARSIIVITPEGERTMNTYLGACTDIGPEDMDADVVRTSQVTYFEGYLWDPPLAKDALREAASIAHKAGSKVALTLSDAFCVDRYRDEFRTLIQNKTIDILLANEAELLSLYETDDFEGSLEKLQGECDCFAITRSEKGAVLVKDGEKVLCNAYPVSDVVDTTGAGDMFAAGYLYGLTHGMSLEDTGKLGCLLASKIIQVVGPRLDTDLKEIAIDAGFDL